MLDFKVCYDGSVRFKRKPNNYDAAMISERLPHCSNTIHKDKVNSFVSNVGQEGVPFCPATFKYGKRKQENFEQMQLFALDFDNKDANKRITVEEAINRAKEYDLSVFFAYDTFSSVNHDKFRIVFLNDAPITDIRVAKLMLTELQTLFPEADSSCSKDVSRMFYGGKRLLRYDKSVPVIDVETLTRGMTSYLRQKHGISNYKRQIEQIAKQTGVMLTNRKHLAVSIENEYAEDSGANSDDKNSTFSTIIGSNSNIDGNVGNLSNRFYRVNFREVCTSSPGDKKTDVKKLLRSSALSDLGSRCRLVREFESGTKRLHHNELRALATSYIQFYSGITRFQSVLKSNSYFEDRPEKYSAWDRHLSYFVQQQYKPQSCSSFCEYHDNCPHRGTNILSGLKTKIERIPGYNDHFVPLEDAVRDFQRKFMAAVTAAAIKWYIIKSQTAIGKTYAILKLLKDTRKKILIAVPTNELKHEVRERAEADGVALIESPSLRELEKILPDDVWDHIETLYNSGLSVIPYLKKVICGKHPECSELLGQYLKELDTFYKHDGFAITTHKRLLTMDVSKYDLVIIDEDILYTCVLRNKADISISVLKRLKKKTAPNSALGKKVRKVLDKSKEAEFFKLPMIEYDEAEDGKTMGVDLPSFCSATHFCFRKGSDREKKQHEDCITSFKPVELNTKVKHIMVSATVDETICGFFLNDYEMEFYECSKALYKGTVNQYPEKTMSRSCIDKDPDIISRIKRWSGFKYTITFLKYQMGKWHYGNTEGCDKLKGEDTDIIGTPHQPEWIYKLFAYTFGPKCNISEPIKRGTIAEHNGWRFRSHPTRMKR